MFNLSCSVKILSFLCATEIGAFKPTSKIVRIHVRVPFLCCHITLGFRVFIFCLKFVTKIR